MSTPVAALGSDTRAAFITRTYLHLFGAILLFAGIEVVLFKSGLAEVIAGALLGVNWLLVLGGFVVVSWFASRAAHRAELASRAVRRARRVRARRSHHLRAAALHRGEHRRPRRDHAARRG